MDLSVPVFLVAGVEDFVVMFSSGTNIENKMVWYGKVYPIYRYDDRFEYISENSSDAESDATKAQLWFEFSYCWRGVWEGRVYLKQEEFWGEDIELINDLWNQIQKILKDRIKQDNPDYGHFDE